MVLRVYVCVCLSCVTCCLRYIVLLLHEMASTVLRSLQSPLAVSTSLLLKFMNHSQSVHKHTMTLFDSRSSCSSICTCVCVGLCATCSHRYTLLLLHAYIILWHCAQSQSTAVQTYSSSCHAVHIKFMNSHKYTHNQSESMN